MLRVLVVVAGEAAPRKACVLRHPSSPTNAPSATQPGERMVEKQVLGCIYNLPALVLVLVLVYGEGTGSAARLEKRVKLNCGGFWNRG